jgi:erythromycin esterase
MTRCLLGVWHTREMVPLFEHIRSSRNSPFPLRLAGFDIQPIGTNKAHRPGYLAAVTAIADTSRANRVRALDSLYLAEYGKSSAARRTFFRNQRQQLLEEYDGLVAFIEANRAVLEARVGRDSTLLARQTAKSIAAYVRQQTAPDNRTYAELRDEAMADNVAFLATELFRGRKMVIWAHNYHVSGANERITPHADVFPGVPARAMGSWLRERFGDRLYTIGVYAYEGSAVDNSRSPYAIPAPAEGSLEQHLASANWRLSFTDIAAAGRVGFLRGDREFAARFNGQIEQRMRPGEQYDAILFLAKVTPSAFLY